MITGAGIVFDLDDTLFMEYDFVRSGFEFVSSYLSDKYGIDGGDREMLDDFHSGARGDIFNRLLLRHGVKQSELGERVSELVAVYHSHTPAIEVSGDVVEELEALIKAGARLGLITDGVPEVQRAKVQALGLDAFMERIVFTWDRGRQFGKPHPVSFTDMEKHLGVSGSKMVYIADNAAKDFTAPQSLGWRTVWVRQRGSLYGSNSPPAGVVPDLQMASLRGLSKFLRQLLDEKVTQ